MSGSLITIKAKTRSGVIQDIQVAEIISIDGRPYTPAGDMEAILQTLNHLTGRIATLETIVAGRQPQE